MAIKEQEVSAATPNHVSGSRYPAILLIYCTKFTTKATSHSIDLGIVAAKVFRKVGTTNAHRHATSAAHSCSLSRCNALGTKTTWEMLALPTIIPNPGHLRDLQKQLCRDTRDLIITANAFRTENAHWQTTPTTQSCPLSRCNAFGTKPTCDVFALANFIPSNSLLRTSSLRSHATHGTST